MELGIDTVPTVCLDDTAIFRLGNLFYHVAIVSEECSRLHEFDGGVQ